MIVEVTGDCARYVCRVGSSRGSRDVGVVGRKRGINLSWLHVLMGGRQDNWLAEHRLY